MKHRHITPLIFSCIFLMGMGGTMKKTPDFYRAQLQRIDLSDGVSEEEAVIIAQNYLLENGYKDGYIISSPSVGTSSLIDGCWVVEFPTTFSVRLQQGLKWLRAHVDKKTGQIKSSGWGPS